MAPAQPRSLKSGSSEELGSDPTSAADTHLWYHPSPAPSPTFHSCGLEFSAFPAGDTASPSLSSSPAQTGKCLSLRQDREGTLCLGMPPQVGHDPGSPLSPLEPLRCPLFGAEAEHLEPVAILSLTHTSSSSPDLTFRSRSQSCHSLPLVSSPKHEGNQHNEFVCSGNPITVGSVSLGWIFSVGSLGLALGSWYWCQHRAAAPCAWECEGDKVTKQDGHSSGVGLSALL